MIEWNKICHGCMRPVDNATEPCPYCGFQETTYEKAARWLPIGAILNEKYVVGKVLGEGGFGITYIGWDINLQVKIAIKEYFPIRLAGRSGAGENPYSVQSMSNSSSSGYQKNLERFVSEAKNLSKFYNLPGIVSVKDFFFENDTAYMIMEYVDGVDLKTYLKEHSGCLPEQQVLDLMRPVMESLKLVHKAGIVHRDISPDNIMMTADGRIKLIDFGAARMTAGDDKEHSLTIILKHGYAPAEQYQTHGNQGPWTDVYALCATMYHMLTGKIPPSAADRIHEDGLIPFEEAGVSVSAQTANAIYQGLAVRVGQRIPSMDALLEAIYGEGLPESSKGTNHNHELSEFSKHTADKKGASDSVNKSAKPISLTQPKRTALIAIGLVLLILLIGGGVVGSGILKKGEQAESGNALLSDATKDSQNALNSQNAMDSQNATDSQNAQTSDSQMDTDLQNIDSTSSEVTGSIPVSTEQQASQDSQSLGEEVELRYTVEQIGALQKQAKETQATLAAADYQVLIIKDDGSVLAKGDNGEGQLSVSKWSQVKAVSAGTNYSIGLLADGTVVTAGNEDSGKAALDLWGNLVEVKAGSDHTLGLTAEGTVLAAGSNSDGQAGTGSWKDVSSVAVGKSHSLALHEDGTVEAVGSNQYGQCDTRDWTDISQIYAWQNLSVGLKKDGTVVSAGSLEKDISIDLSGFTNIISVAVGDTYIALLRADGRVLLQGEYNSGIEAALAWSDVACIAAGKDHLFGRKNDGNIVYTSYQYGNASLEEFVNLKELVCTDRYLLGLTTAGKVLLHGLAGMDLGVEEISGWTDIVGIAGNATGIAGLKADGTVVTVGTDYESASNWEDIAQIAMTQGTLAGLVKDTGRVRLIGSGAKDYRESVQKWLNMVMLAGGSERQIFGLSDDGTFYTPGMAYDFEYPVVDFAVGLDQGLFLFDNHTVSARGVENGTVSTASYGNVTEWKDIVDVACGDKHSVGLKSDGTVVAAGNNYNGQCNVSDWKDVTAIYAGPDYTAGITATGELLLAGHRKGNY